MSAAGNENTNTNPNFIFTMKETKLYVPVVTLSAKIFKNYQNFLVKDLRCQFFGMNIKQKVRIVIRQMNIDIFSNQIW